MKALGIDIGTTTISAVVLEDENPVIRIAEKNDSFLLPEFSGEKAQNPEKILSTVFSITERLFAIYPDIRKIGVTGQMHGILYLDKEGNSVSPLYTWQDERGDCLCQKEGIEETWVNYLRRKTGCFVATGYGWVTHSWHLDMDQRDRKKEWFPATAVTCCTIGDYIAMKLCGLTKPVMDASNAASLGFFDVENGRFDEDALKLAGIGLDFLPELAKTPCIGTYREKADVMAAIGDNQASFLGTMKDNDNAMLVNVGTGSQFSVFTKHYMSVENLETRPMPGGGYLLVGASLCGGRAYALLEHFFRMSARMTGMDTVSCYEYMEKLLKENPRPAHIPKVIPLFQGTRQDTGLTGSITGLTVNNFTPLHLIWGMMEGMADELNQMYRQYLKAGGEKKMLIGSGNGLQKNKFLQNCIETAFGCTLKMSDNQEEAAAGAALFALKN